jgi:tRNA dimethylallyltransferase
LSIVNCLVGPTASGKTALAVRLAQALNAEIVTCDSMQVYRGMDIGTAKPTLEERGGIPHHMLDVADPQEGYSAARYAEQAERCIRDVAARGKLPLLAGGTGLYLRALTRPLHTAAPGAEDDPRTNGELHAALNAVDPETAKRLPPGDRRRVLRALSVYRGTGVPLSRHHAESQTVPPRWRTRILGLTCADRQTLYDRIDRRVDDMLRLGLRDEVQGLLDAGLDEDCTAMQAIGYKEMAEHLHGRCTLEQAADAIRRNTRRLAKRQLTWFTRQETVLWLDCEDSHLLDKALQGLREL